MASTKVTMKLLIDTQSKRVMFAEADKECIDFLFHILALPIGSVIRLLTTKGMVGCLGNLYESLEKDTLLKPKSVACGTSVPLLLITNTPAGNQFYMCSGCYNYVTDGHQIKCHSCHGSLNKKVNYILPPQTYVVASDRGLVKGVVTYMVLDDLIVKPMSTISSITLLNQFSIKNVNVLKEKVVTLGMDEALKLLKMSLQSKNVLTSVFMDNINE
ncbi:unnamed protein product [Withania somnifera]